VARCIIAKLPPSWRGFTTSLKHKRQKIYVKNLIASLDIEDKAWAKDNIGKGNKGHPSTNFVKRNSNGKNKGKNKPFNANQQLPSRRRKIKQSCLASLVESLVTFPKCPERADRKGKRRNVNLMATSNVDDGYDNFPTVLLVFQSPS
jgi:hypothetical protein